MIRDAYRALKLVVLFIALVMIGSWLFTFGRARLAARPAPPPDWALKAKPDDLFQLAGYNISYWGKPNAPYGVYATKRKKKLSAIVVHFTRARPVLAMVNYGHRRDFSRGGGAFGYHFYVGRGGGIAQGAPLSKRTNHIKPARRPQRKARAKHLWSGNTIGISLVGGCDRMMELNWFNGGSCSGEYVTAAQLRAGLALIRALQKRFGLSCSEVYGHGELQTDRAPFEGAALAKMARAPCPKVEKSP